MFANILWYFLLCVEGLCCFLLVGVILLQRTKGQGMGVALGGGMAETIFGSQMGNVLTKTTVVLAIVFLATTTALAYLTVSRKAGSVADGIPTTAAPVAAPMTPAGTPATETVPLSIPSMPIEPVVIDEPIPAAAPGEGAAPLPPMDMTPIGPAPVSAEDASEKKTE